MYTKYRNGPRYMYRSNAMGIGGVAAASRVSPEGSMRGYRMYNADYYRDGHGRGGRAKHFQTLPPPQEADIFMEAGRLAAEYLVSKGVLPPNALSGKWQSDGLKNQVGNFQGFRQHEVDKPQVPANGRPSAHSRLGNVAIEVGQGWRRYSDDYNSMGLRSSIQGRKRAGSFKEYGSDLNRELERSQSWAEKSRASPGMESDNEAEEGNGKDVAQENTGEVNVVSGMEKYNEADITDANNTTSSNRNSLPSDTNGELIKRRNGAAKADEEAEVEKRERNDNDSQQKRDKNESATISMTGDTLVSDDHVDLVKHCKFVNVSTRARSSLATRGSKVDQKPKKEDANIPKRECSGGSGTHAMDDKIGTSGSASSHQNHELLNAPVPAVKKEPDGARGAGLGDCSMSESFSEISTHKEQNKEEELSGFQTSNSSFRETGQKRVMYYDADGKENVKKIQRCNPLTDSQSLSTSMENRSTAQELGILHDAHVTLSPDQESLGISFFQKGHADPCEFMEEKQLFPGSFKTCDLNLVGSCDGNENNDVHSMLVYPSVTQVGKVKTIDMDLSMSNNRALPYCEHGHKDNPIEVIDYEDDSALEHRAFSDPENRGDAVFTDLDGFPNNVHNGNGISDVHDGYGLMISELLANGAPNCSSVSTGLNSLHNTEGMLGDDDSIYMSLGEIPISILGPWEQPNQDYGKPF